MSTTGSTIGSVFTSLGTALANSPSLGMHLFNSGRINQQIQSLLLQVEANSSSSPMVAATLATLGSPGPEIAPIVSQITPTTSPETKSMLIAQAMAILATYQHQGLLANLGL